MGVMGRPPVNLLSRTKIAREALAMYDRDGAANFSLRRLAEQLNVKSPSLYGHVAGQSDLVDAMRDLVQEEVGVSALDDPDWRSGISRHARSYRVAFGRHPEVSLLIARRPVGPSGIAWYDQQIAGFMSYGLDEQQALQLSAAIDFLVFGSMMLPHCESLAAGAHAEGQNDSDSDHPSLRASLTARRWDPHSADMFEWALDGLLDGIKPLFRRG